MTFAAAVPEVPVAHIKEAAAYYVQRLGFTVDWGDEDGGIAGISRGSCRLFLTNRTFREHYGNLGPVLLWINQTSRDEVDEVYSEWIDAEAKLLSEPADKPWNLREFTAGDLDGNMLRVFYDLRGEAQGDVR